MHILKRGSGYEAHVHPEGSVRWYPMNLRISESDVQELNGSLQTAMQDVASHADAAEVWNSLREGAGPLVELARWGRFAFETLFPEAWMRRLITSSLYSGATIEIPSDELFLPWELLYSDDRPRHRMSGFWGMKYNIARKAPVRSTEEILGWSDPGVSQPAILTSCPRLGLIVSEELEFVRDVELPAFKQLRDRAVIALELLDPLDSAQWEASMTRFRDFVGNELDLLHLACHAEADRAAPQMLLQVSTEFPIKYRDFSKDGRRIPRGAFVVLNACRTGTVTPGSAFGWARLFLEKGARGVLATEFMVPDDFAPQFASRFYEHFLTGVPVGEAVLRARRECWCQMSSPLGLGYALYSTPEIRIVTQETDGWKRRR